MFWILSRRQHRIGKGGAGIVYKGVMLTVINSRREKTRRDVPWIFPRPKQRFILGKDKIQQAHREAARFFALTTRRICLSMRYMLNVVSVRCVLHEMLNRTTSSSHSNFEAHVADFGLAKFLQDSGTSECMSVIADLRLHSSR
ncbi:leucine-rich repeat receptor-like serine/threonine-protein kinase BAM1 [Raphanus sativus]|uniref:Leucine-rich repeat receptor-like serine/threonine-protein kinase BAM1 n=1 Tax=Raphanus sativus TaxID=3726 RepID=A0A9W3CPX7_RAPSA|nr:leucine-rich repeat receptor-like serine/threonine-protein kinase BAM1 [Raphanus sativus]